MIYSLLRKLCLKSCFNKIVINRFFFVSKKCLEAPTDLPPTPTMELSQGGMRCHVRDTRRDISVGSNFTLFCNVTLNNHHNLKMDWFKDVSSVEHSVWKQFTLKGYPIFTASIMFF